MILLDANDADSRFAVNFKLDGGGEFTVFDSAETARLALGWARGAYQKEIVKGLTSVSFHGSHRDSFFALCDKLTEDYILPAWFVRKGGVLVLVLAHRHNLAMAVPCTLTVGSRPGRL